MTGMPRHFFSFTRAYVRYNSRANYIYSLINDSRNLEILPLLLLLLLL